VKSRKGVRGLLGVVVGLLALLGVGAAATHYLYEPYNPGFLEYPTIVALHVVLGGLYLALAPFQFVRRIRSRHLVGSLLNGDIQIKRVPSADGVKQPPQLWRRGRLRPRPPEAPQHYPRVQPAAHVPQCYRP
jgi:hypothetical protein